MSWFKARALGRLVSVLFVLLAACSDSTEPSGEPGVYLAGVVRGPDGTPVPLGTVTWSLWPGPDSTDASQDRFWYTDSLGRFGGYVGTYNVVLIDSIDVQLIAPECLGFSQVIAVRERAVPVNVEVPDTVLFVEFELAQVAPRARVAVGQYCTTAYDPHDIFSAGRFGLWIDEISDSVRGRWRINYQMSRGDDYGQFSGAVEGGNLTLDLRHDDPFDDCTNYTLTAPVGAGGTLGTASYSSDGCPAWDWDLRFAESDAVDWHWPVP